MVRLQLQQSLGCMLAVSVGIQKGEDRKIKKEEWLNGVAEILRVKKIKKYNNGYIVQNIASNIIREGIDFFGHNSKTSTVNGKNHTVS